jgi:hypothetical protein
MLTSSVGLCACSQAARIKRSRISTAVWRWTKNLKQSLEQLIAEAKRQLAERGLVR